MPRVTASCPATRRPLATLTEQSQRQHRLVGDLSAVSRAEERQLNLHPVLVSAQDLVSGALTAARPRFDAKGISLTVEATVTASQVLVDPDRLAEALGALLDNALRHTGTWGLVTIAATRQNDQRCRSGSWWPTTAKGSTPPLLTSCSSASTGRLITQRRRRRKRHRADHRQGDR
jgi:signal transduction histidine kinase